MGFKILLAEDERSLSRASAHMLSKNGYEVIQAYDGEETLKVLQETDIDLVILDVMMPKKDGIQVLKELRAAENDVKIIMLTAKSEMEDKLEGLENNADDYITKPFDYRELMARIRILLKDFGQKPDLEFSDIYVDTEKKCIRGLKSSSASYSLTEGEYKLLKKLHGNTSVKKTVLEPVVGGNDKLVLYTRYVNNKLKALSSVLRIQDTGSELILRGTQEVVN